VKGEKTEGGDKAGKRALKCSFIPLERRERRQEGIRGDNTHRERGK